nr:MAG TPA: hypothetical protein [Bacteriophage sp.]
MGEKYATKWYILTIKEYNKIVSQPYRSPQVPFINFYFPNIRNLELSFIKQLLINTLIQIN